jgi:hypothetical protein
MADNKKIFVGSGWVQHPQWLKASITERGLHELLNNLEGSGGKRYAKININILHEKNQFGKDVEISRDTWKKDANYSGSKPKLNEPIDADYIESIPNSEIPF